MAQPVKRQRAPARPSTNWQPNKDVRRSTPNDPPEVRAEKDRLIAEYLTRRETR